MKKHNVFVSYHHDEDQDYRDCFEALFRTEVFISKSVGFGEIDPNLKPDTVRRIIRDEYLRDSTVTIVLIGKYTWQRKYVDWEIGSSIRKTEYNSRSGLIGVFLPTHPNNGGKDYDENLIPPRLAHNHNCGFAELYNWTENPETLKQWIHDAFNRRGRVDPDNSFPHFIKNRTGERWQT